MCIVKAQEKKIECQRSHTNASKINSVLCIKMIREGQTSLTSLTDKWVVNSLGDKLHF